MSQTSLPNIVLLVPELGTRSFELICAKSFYLKIEIHINLLYLYLPPSPFSLIPMFRPSPSPYPREQSSLIGIAVSIGGNILISLALNCQKLAHKRLNAESKHPPPTNDRDPNPRPPNTEEQPLIPSPNTLLPTNSYGLNLDPTPNIPIRPEQHYVTSRPSSPSEASLEELSQTRYRSVHGIKPPDSPPRVQPAQSNETGYLRSKLWWVIDIIINTTCIAIPLTLS